MADDRPKIPPKMPTGSSTNLMSPLERYLAKQKQEKAAQAAKESPPPKPRVALGKASQKAAPPARTAADFSVDERPSLANIQRPPSTEAPQPSSLRRWEAVAEDRLHETEKRAQEGGAPPRDPGSAGDFAQSAADHVRPVTDSPLVADGFVNATFGPRLVASFIDGLIVSGLTVFANKIVLAIVAIGAGPLVELHETGLRSLVWLLAVYAYYGYFYSIKGASPGKLMMSLEVRNADSVSYVTPFKAFLREAIGKTISAIPLFMGYFIILIRADHRALHDLLFDTRVVRRSETPR